ncbi:MFS general substrate transporter [Calocera viscosa TUFC12733]|uniref:MFS-type drug efflux transporter P55 n=1 Tax=Calocera viscosa (strain TUFC12733) TaxID=1330018 RepID=A0A167L526_CALVF|nr:MFS general substrate transporter [Calocera viscosa TUFC12733]
MPIELRRLFLGRHTPRGTSNAEGDVSAAPSGSPTGSASAVTRSALHESAGQKEEQPLQPLSSTTTRVEERVEDEPHDGARSPSTGEAQEDNSARAEDGGQRREVTPAMTKLELQLTFLSLSVTGFLSALDSSIIATAMPTIASQFNSLSQQQWISLSYLLTSTVFQPLFGRATDLWGSRSVLFVTIFFFELGSLLCAVSQNFIWLCCARAIAGAGAGGIAVVIMVILSQIVPLRERGNYMGIMYARLVISTVFGPLIGGAFVQWNWRWCFYINLILAVPALAIQFAFIRKLPHTTKPNVTWRDVDVGGIALVAAFTTSLALAFNWGGVVYAWNSPLIIALLVVGFVLTPIFVFWEIKIAPFPLIPMNMFKYRNVTAGVANNFFSSVSLQGIFLFIPSYYQIVRKDSQIISGLDILPYVVPVLLVSTITGRVISKTGRVREYLWLGGLINLVGTALLTLVDGKYSRAMEYVLLFFCGIGAGFLMGTITLSAQSDVSKDLIATVTTMTLWSRRLGIILAAAMQGSIISNTFKNRILASAAAAPYVTQLLAADNVSSLPVDVQIVAAQSYGAAFQMMMVGTTIFCAPGFFWSLAARKPKLD